MSTFFQPLRRGLLACIGACLWLLSSCGGGAGGQASNTGNGGGIGSGGTGSYTNGPISGLGSIIVNGVRYDVGQAQEISDDDGVSYDTSALKLGMQVEVTGTAVTAGVSGALPTASAAQVRFASALLGPVEQVPDTRNGGCACLTVLGQTVKFTSTTVMPVTLTTDDVVEVYGQPDRSNGNLIATRVQVVDHVLHPTANMPYKLVGWVQGSNAINLGLHTVIVTGPSTSLTLTYTGAQLNALEEIGSSDRPVRVWLQRAVDLSQRHALARALVSDRLLVTDRDEARLEGLVTVAADAGTGRMSINGQVVDVSGVLSSVTGLTVGQRVRVDGGLVDGVLKVTEVNTSVGEGGEEDDGIELHGVATDLTSLSSTTATMVVRGVTVLYDPRSPTPTIVSGQTCLEVEGSGFNAAGQLVATSIKRDDDCHSER